MYMGVNSYDRRMNTLGALQETCVPCSSLASSKNHNENEHDTSVVDVAAAMQLSM